MTARLEFGRSLLGKYPQRLICKVLGLNRSSLIYRSDPAPDSKELEEAILEFKSIFVNAGVRYMYELLLRHGIRCSRNKVRDIYIQHGLLQKRAKPRIRTTDSRHPHPIYPNLVKKLEITSPDQVWCTDVTAIKVGRRWAYLDVILDAYTRRILSWSLSPANDTLLCSGALYLALRDGKPEIHHSDQGRPYASDRYTGILKNAGIQISMASTASPWENSYIERINRTIKDEEVRLSEYRTLDEAKAAIESWVELYNHGRLHSSLNFYTPVEFFEMYEPEPLMRVDNHP